jgi:hypothetical protein
MEDNIAAKVKTHAEKLALVAMTEEPRVAIAALVFAAAVTAAAHGVPPEVLTDITDKASDTVYQTAADLNYF